LSTANRSTDADRKSASLVIARSRYVTLVKKAGMNGVMVIVRVGSVMKDGSWHDVAPLASDFGLQASDFRPVALSRVKGRKPGAGSPKPFTVTIETASNTTDRASIETDR